MFGLKANFREDFNFANGNHLAKIAKIKTSRIFVRLQYMTIPRKFAWCPNKIKIPIYKPSCMRNFKSASAAIISFDYRQIDIKTQKLL